MFNLNALSATSVDRHSKQEVPLLPTGNVLADFLKVSPPIINERQPPAKKLPVNVPP